MENIKILLSHIDLSKTEAETFSALLQYPDGISVLELSRTLNLPRPTIYSHIEKFTQIGIAKKGIKENTSLFYPETKDIIQQVFEDKIKFLKSSKEMMSGLLDEVHTSVHFRPKFFVYEGPTAYEQVWRDILRTKEEAFWLWPIKDMLKTVSKDKLKEFHKERIQRNIWINVLWPEKSKVDINNSPFLLFGNEERSLRRIRILPKKLEQDTGYGVYGNKAAFISSKKENYAFIVESKELAETLKKQFDFLWGISKNIKL